MTAATLTSALCAQVDPDLWHPAKGQSNTAAKKICHRCDDEAACLAIALADPELDGIWGGTTHRERQAMRRGVTIAPKVRPIRHGTEGGYKVHRDRGETPCPECKTGANAAHQKRRAGQVRGAA